MSPNEIAEKYGVIANPNAVKRELKKYTAPAVNVTTAGAKTKPSFTQKAEPKKPAPEEKLVNAEPAYCHFLIKN